MKQGFFLILALALCAAEASADAAAGARKARICLSCHVPQHRLAAMPLLGGQPAPYLYAQLKAYKENTRADPTATMPSSAANLSDLDMREIASFLATQQAPSVAYQVDPAKAALGKKMAAELGCGNCHDAEKAAGSAVPRLAGQAVGYSIAQLQAFVSGKRAHGAGRNAAPALSVDSAEIDALANHFAQPR